MRLPARYKTGRFWFSIGLALPFAVATPLFLDWAVDLKSLGLDDLVAVLAGMMMLMLGVMIVASAILPNRTAPRSQLFFSALTMSACGVVLLIPPLAPEALDSRVSFGLFVAALALSYLPTWQILRSSDEMHRRMVADASFFGYHAFSLAIMLYAAASALGLEMPFNLWSVIAVMTVAQLLISGVLGARRHAPLPADEPA